MTPPQKSLSAASLSQKIVLWSSLVGFLLITACYLRLSLLYDDLMALYLVQSEINLIEDYCAEDFTRMEGNYEISLVNDGESRTVSATWKSFWMEKKNELSFLNPPECQN